MRRKLFENNNVMETHKPSWKSYLVPVGATLATVGLTYAMYHNRKAQHKLLIDKPSMYTAYREPNFSFDYYSSSDSATSSDYDSSDPYVDDELVDLLQGFKFN